MDLATALGKFAELEDTGCYKPKWGDSEYECWNEACSAWGRHYWNETTRRWEYEFKHDDECFISIIHKAAPLLKQIVEEYAGVLD